MTLSKHVDADKIEDKLLQRRERSHSRKHLEYLTEYSSEVRAPRREIPDKSSSGSLIVKYLEEELSLDGVPELNLATFVSTDVDEEPLKLIVRNLTKNLADNDEYPSLIELQSRCISILSSLWHAPKHFDHKSGKHVTNTIGTATTGSSEAILLAGLALKKNWQAKRQAEGKPTDKPNILMASCAQVALEKFARYFDVEARLIHVNESNNHLMDISKIKANIDENTIGIFVIAGSTFTGAFEPVEKISHILDEVQQERGLDIKIHVDGASGGFVAPFVYPHFKWDFDVDRVVSINTSGHKYGLTTAGLGWVIWKHEKLLPDSLRFKLDYLGGIEETFTLNFSRPGFNVIHQYYNLLTYGREGYANIFNSCLRNARLLSNFLLETKYFDVLSVIHQKLDTSAKSEIYTRGFDTAYTIPDALANEDYMPGLPVVSFRFSKSFREKYPFIPQSILSLLLKNRGFIVPNYKLPPDEEEKEVLRVVVRQSLSLNLLEKLMNEITRVVEILIDATENIDVVTLDGKRSLGERKNVVHNVLLSIASGGAEADKQTKHKTLNENNEFHKKPTKSYRGTC